MLMVEFTLEEIKSEVFSMGAEKGLGPDGFTTLFFQKCWDFVGKDILLAPKESRRNKNVLKEMNSIFIALIPNKFDSVSFNDFKPISLCNSIYKIFTKAISSRLANLLPLIISDEQGGFVLGKDTLEGAILAIYLQCMINPQQWSLKLICQKLMVE